MVYVPNPWNKVEMIRLARMQRECSSLNEEYEPVWNFHMQRECDNYGSESQLRSSNFRTARDPTSHRAPGGHPVGNFRMGSHPESRSKAGRRGTVTKINRW